MTTYNPVVQELVDKIENNPGWKSRFTEAIKLALESGVQEMQQFPTLDAYLKRINDFLYWVPSETYPGRDVYYRICEFYFVMNQKPVKELQDPLKPGQSLHPDSELTLWLKEYARELGKWHDDPNSLTPQSLKSFRNSPSYNMNEYIEPRGGWRTFNDFFARSVKPGYRPVAGITDPTVITSPADSTYGGQFEVRSDSGVTIKNLHWSISELLAGSPYKDRFNGGIFTHAFLGPNDYHRQHTPVGPARVLEARNIVGDVYLEVNAVDMPPADDGSTKKLQALRSTDGAMRGFDAPDTPGYQFSQARGLLVLETPIGLVAVLPMGMAQVSSVVLTAEENITLRKGEEISYFQFGGSDIVTVFEARSNVSITAQLGTHYKMGTRIGQAFPVQ